MRAMTAECECQHTVRCHYNKVNFVQNRYKIHPIACPLGRGMGCILWVQTLICTLLQSQQQCNPYQVIFDCIVTCIITALECTYLKNSNNFNTISPPNLMNGNEDSNKLVRVQIMKLLYIHKLLREPCGLVDISISSPTNNATPGMKNIFASLIVEIVLYLYEVTNILPNTKNIYNW